MTSSNDRGLSKNVAGKTFLNKVSVHLYTPFKLEEGHPMIGNTQPKTWRVIAGSSLFQCMTSQRYF